MTWFYFTQIETLNNHNSCAKQGFMDWVAGTAFGFYAELINPYEINFLLSQVSCSRKRQRNVIFFEFFLWG